MTATKELPKSHGELELQKQYGIALRIWSEARGLYQPHSPEVLSATALVEELEEKLIQHPAALLPAKQIAGLLPDTPLNADEKP